MFQELKFQLSTAILTILTVAAAVAAVINFDEQLHFRLPEDGVIWVDRAPGVQALLAPSDSPAGRAGVRSGDWLKSINTVQVEKASDVIKILWTVGAWQKVTYHVVRGGTEFDVKDLVVGEVPRDHAILYQYAVGFSYLIIGLFVYFRRGSAQKARHFYVLCLVSFVAFCFHFTAQLNGFDKVIYFANLAAVVTAPAVFLHFCLTFPERRRWFKQKTGAVLLYAGPAALFLVYISLSSGAVKVNIPLLEINWLLDRLWILLASVPYIVGGFALSAEYRKAEDPIVRQQLKWLRNGTFAGVLPFTVLYGLPFVLGALPGNYQKAAVGSLILIPLTLAYAIVRYRLMDVDIIFRRGYAYTLATLCVLASFYGIVFGLGSLVKQNFQGLGQTVPMAVMLIAAFLFQPIRTWIQERLDKYFYRDRYDYRRTLVEFARELSSETDLDTMLSSAGDRLLQTLSIQHLAFFLSEEGPAGEEGPRFQLKKAMGANPRLAGSTYDDLDLSFLNWKLPEGYLFFERTRHQLDAISRSWPPSVRRTIADLDLTYYLPCTVRGRTIAYLGVSRTADGDYLSSVDVELLRHALRLRGHRHRECLALPLAAAQGGRVRAAQGIQREHRRIDQRGNSGGRPGRPRGELEHPDRAVERHAARARPGPAG